MSAPSRILVVDDTPQNVKLLADLLGVKGYAVTTAASGPEALAQVEAERPDLVLLDVVMPGMSGYEVCRKIRELEGTGILPVIMVTALDPGQERIKGLEAGAADTVMRPPSGVNFTALERRFSRTCLIFRSSASKSPTRSSTARVTVRPWRSARSRTRVRAFCSATGKLNDPSSSSIRPASTLDRSRMSLIRERRCWPEARMSR